MVWGRCRYNTVVLFRSHRFNRVKDWRSSAAALVVAFVIAMGCLITPAIGATNDANKQKQINGQISDLREQMGEMSEDAAKLLEKIDALEARKKDLEGKTNALQGEIRTVETELTDANNRLAAVQRSIDQAQAKLDDATRQIAENKTKLEDLAIAAYMGGEPSENLAGFLLRGGDLREATAADEYRSQVVTDRKELLEAQRKLELQAKDARAALEAVKAQAEADRALVVQRQSQLEAQKSSLLALQAQAVEDAKKQGEVLGEVEAKRASIQAEMDGLQRQSDAIAERIRQQQAANSSKGATPSRGTPAPAGRGIFANPVPGMPMTSPFGMRQHPVLGGYRMHNGQDFGAPSGTPIHAAADGVVITVMPSSQSGGYGNYTCIDHGSGLASCYAHQSQFMVSDGQRVKRGQVIGLVGSTGYSTGAHLHFEVRINGVPVDPRSYL